MFGWRHTLWTSLGKKLLMSVTGLCFCGFLVSHLAGNLTLLGGRAAFNGYAARLHALGPVLTVVEVALLILALVHVVTGLVLFYQNRLARPVRYQVDKWAGGRTPGSATMPYTGVLLLSFVVFHLAGFTFVDKTGTGIYEIVSATFQRPLHAAIYVIAVIIAGVHVSHGFWSAFQSLGANHPRYMPLIKALGLVLAVLVALGFGSLPVFMSLTA